MQPRRLHRAGQEGPEHEGPGLVAHEVKDHGGPGLGGPGTQQVETGIGKEAAQAQGSLHIDLVAFNFKCQTNAVREILAMAHKHHH